MEFKSLQVCGRNIDHHKYHEQHPGVLAAFPIMNKRGNLLVLDSYGYLCNENCLKGWITQKR